MCSTFRFSDSAPQDIEEARALFKKLYGMLGTDQKNVVPQRVYLFPIKYIKTDPLMSLLKVFSNKPNRATMRLDCFVAYFHFGAKHVTYIWRDRWTNSQMKGRADRWIDRVAHEALKTRRSIIWFSLGSHRGQNRSVRPSVLFYFLGSGPEGDKVL